MVFDMGRVLEVTGVNLRIGRKPILQDISLTVDRGEFVVLLGPNGAGKSSLLRVLSGERRLQEGQVRIAGKTLADWRRRKLALHRAVMPQRVEINFPFTVREVVALGCQSDCKDSRNVLVEHLLARLEVGGLVDRLISTLSGGEQQRVQLARVLAQLWGGSGAQLLLLDECTSALDPAQQQLVFGLLRELAREKGYAILAVVHDLNLAAAYADRLMIMRDGYVVADGPARKVLAPQMLRQVYGLNARVELLPEGYPLVVPIAHSEASNELAVGSV